MGKLDDKMKKKTMENNNISEEQIDSVLKELVKDGFIEKKFGNFRLTYEGIDYVERKILRLKK